MNLVAGKLNGSYVETLVHHHVDECAEVIALVAYCSDKKLFELCQKAGKKVTFIGRLDESAPVSSRVLRWFLDQNSVNLNCALLRGGHHAKVIWFRNVGAYIGSANLSDRAWNSNIEVGVFLTEGEMEEQGMLDELEAVIAFAHTNAIKLDQGLYKMVLELEKQQPSRVPVMTWFEKNAKLYPETPSPVSHDKKVANERALHEFLAEWNSTLDTLRKISTQLLKYRPSWVAADVRNEVHVDQFLHGYYYTKVRGDGNQQPFDEHFERYKTNPAAALDGALAWWRDSNIADFREEKHFMDVWAPRSHALLAKDKLLHLTVDEFAELCSYIHAIRDHASKQSNLSLGLAGQTSPEAEKIEAFGRKLYLQRTDDNESVLTTIYHVLYGGSADKLPLRIWEASHNKRWKIPHLGISSLGEIVGWAGIPNHFPRNGRTSKTLRALGNDVRVY